MQRGRGRVEPEVNRNFGQGESGALGANEELEVEGIADYSNVIEDCLQDGSTHHFETCLRF